SDGSAMTTHATLRLSAKPAVTSKLSEKSSRTSTNGMTTSRTPKIAHHRARRRSTSSRSNQGRQVDEHRACPCTEKRKRNGEKAEVVRHHRRKHPGQHDLKRERVSSHERKRDEHPQRRLPRHGSGKYQEAKVLVCRTPAM